MQAMLRSPAVQLALAILALAVVYNGSQASLPAFQALPISGINTNAAPRVADSAALSNLYPLVAIAAPQQKTPPTPNDIIPVDDAFIPKTIPKETITSRAQDYFALLNSSHTLNLQAVTNNGAIINNRFYDYDTPLSDFAYPDESGKQTIPVIRRAKQPNAVRIEERPGTRHFQLTMIAN